MKRLKLLQIGDVHFPDTHSERTSDVKDPSFPSALSEVTQAAPLQTVMRCVLRDTYDGILFSGDLTSLGDVPQYVNCLQYLFRALPLMKLGKDRVHAVPGNHDVERVKVDPAGKDLYSKFASFSDAWTDLGLPLLTVSEVRSTQIASGDGAKATVLSINSSLGCGEKWYPKVIKTGLDDLLAKYASAASAADAFKVSGETLDTPAMAKEDIEQLCDRVREVPPTAIPVILSHHNILPQAQLRLDIYTELINAGTLRSRLCGLNRSLIYCHGHIHENPVEIVHDARNLRSQVICISAPQFSRGYNSLTFEFGPNNLPLGCTVNSFNIKLVDDDVLQHEVRIPLQQRGQHYSLGSKDLLRLLAAIPNGDSRYAAILEAARAQKIKRNLKSLVPDLLLQAEWLGCLEIQNRNEEPDYWYVRKLAQ